MRESTKITKLSLALILWGVVSISCSSSKGPPTGPTPGTGVPTGLPVVTLTALDIPNRTAQISWIGAQGATVYDIAVGTTAGGEDIGKLTVPGAANSATLPNLPQEATIHVGVTPRNATGAGGRGSASFYHVDFRAIIETLFFNSGPYSTNFFGGPGQALPTMEGWAPGTRIRILLANEVEYLRPTAEKVAAQLSQMTGGVLTAFVESGGDNVWTAPGQSGLVDTVKVVSTKELPFVPCSPEPFGCSRIFPDRNPVRTRVVLWMGPDSVPAHRIPVFVHELGHALLGFAHWGGYLLAPTARFLCGPSGPPIQFPYLVMCTFDQELRSGNPNAFRDDFTAVEVEAAQRVYAAGLRPGATRAEFVSRGLIQQ